MTKFDWFHLYLGHVSWLWSVKWFPGLPPPKQTWSLTETNFACFGTWGLMKTCSKNRFIPQNTFGEHGPQRPHVPQKAKIVLTCVFMFGLGCSHLSHIPVGPEQVAYSTYNAHSPSSTCYVSKYSTQTHAADILLAYDCSMVLTALIRPHPGHAAASQEAYHTILVSPKGSRKMISGRYFVCPAPNGVARLFRFDWNSRFAKIWWPDESSGSYWFKISCPGPCLNHGQLLKATTIVTFWHIPMSKTVTNSMPDLLKSYCIIHDRNPTFSAAGWGVA